MSDINSLFLPAPTDALNHEIMWDKKIAQDRWFYNAFSSLLETNWHEPNQRRSVSPISIPISANYLTSLHLLAPLTHRPANSKLTTQDFHSQFCKSFLSFTYPRDLVEDINQGKDEHIESARFLNSKKFLFWMLSGMLASAEGARGKYLSFHTPGSLSSFLTDHAKTSRYIKKEKLSAQAQLIPFYVSVFFTLQKQALWPNLRDLLAERDLEYLRFPFRLIELFLNRWTEEGERLFTIDRGDVLSAFKAASGDPFSRSDYKITKIRVLAALRLSIESDQPQSKPRTKTSRSLGRNANLRIQQRFNRFAESLEVSNKREFGEGE